VLAAAAGARTTGPESAIVHPPPNSFDRNADKEPAPSSGAESWLVTAVGVIAVIALLACLAFPIWVLLGDSSDFAERLANYRLWLTWATVVHLTACAIWIVKKNK
jgi:hypothetical protein